MFETKIDKSLIIDAYTDLVRRIRWKWFFKDKVDSYYDPDYDVSSKIPSDKKKRDPELADRHIENGLQSGWEYIRQCVNSVPDGEKVKKVPSPLNLQRAREFVVANNLIVTSTDKNLGVAVFKREWIYEQAATLFDDADNYTALSVQEAVKYLSEMANFVRSLCETHLRDEEQLSKFLCHCLPGEDDTNDWANWKQFVPEAYAIPKIHKNPWKGRPICPGHSLPQNPASKVLAKLVRPFIESFPWVIKGSKDFVTKLADVKIPPGKKAFIVSADVVAFYPSVDLDTLKMILSRFAEDVLIPDERERDVFPEYDDEARLDYYQRMFRIAIAGPVMTFNDKIIYQHKGLPMGAAGSPDAANLFAAWYEHKWMDNVTGNDDILFYGRYLDDIYCIVCAETPDEAVNMLSFVSLGDVKLLWEPATDHANFLDLSTRIQGDSIYHEPFVKAMSHRERIPWSSAHPLDVKKGTFSSEISRLATLCSDHTEYLNQCTEAVNLYIGRGYPPALVTSWLKGQQEKRWRDRLAVHSVEDDAAQTFFTLKTHFNEAWKYLNVGELQTRITSRWREVFSAPVLDRKRKPDRPGVSSRPQKRVKVTLQGQQWSGQSRLTFTHEDGSSLAEGLRIATGRRDKVEFSNESLDARQETAKWITTGKFIVSRKKNTQLWDVTRNWNKLVWDKYLEKSGAYRPFDPSYEGLIIPNQDEQ